VETVQEQQALILDPVADNASVETSFGAPVVREIPPDPGPHERLITVPEVAARLGVSSASVYKLATEESCEACGSEGPFASARG